MSTNDITLVPRMHGNKQSGFLVMRDGVVIGHVGSSSAGGKLFCNVSTVCKSGGAFWTHSGNLSEAESLIRECLAKN